MDETQIPCVRNYLDANQFLQDIYKYRKQIDPAFSYEKWAQELGVSSKSFLRFAILGKRKISETLASAMSKSIFEEENDRSHFLLLVLYTQSQTPSQKKFLAQRIAESLQSTPKVMHSTRAISNPLHMMVRNYLSFEDAIRTIEAISDEFSITPDQTQEILTVLAESDLIESDNDQWRAKHKWVKIDGKPKDQELRHYHNRSLEQAIAAQRLDPSLRTYRSISFALDVEEYRELLAQISAFAQQIAVHFDRDSIQGRRIYQLNLNLIPWSGTQKADQDLDTSASIKQGPSI